MGSKKQSELPSGWVEKTLDEVFKITAGGDIEMENVFSFTMSADGTAP
jgi:hypothetical protein